MNFTHRRNEGDTSSYGKFCIHFINTDLKNSRKTDQITYKMQSPTLAHRVEMHYKYISAYSRHILSRCSDC